MENTRKRLTSKYLLTIFGYKKEELIQRGIYSINFIGCDKLYIGSATQLHDKWNENGFYIRWRYHIYELMSNTHYNKKLQNAFNKYGISAIRFSILKIMSNSSKDDILNTEYEFIKENNSILAGYNCRAKDTYEDYIRKGFVFKRVFVFREFGDFVEEFRSRADCALFFNVPRQKISQLIKSNKPHNGYYFFNENNFFIRKRAMRIRTGMNNEVLRNPISGEEIIVYNSNDNSLKSFYSVNVLANFFNIKDRRNIYLCLNGKIPSTNGLIILYKKDIPNIRIPTKTFCCITDGDVIIKKYPSLLSMSKELGYSEVAIENYLVGKGKKGFIKHEIKRLRLPIEIYDKFLNLIKENEQRETS